MDGYNTKGIFRVASGGVLLLVDYQGDLIKEGSGLRYHESRFPPKVMLLLWTVTIQRGSPELPLEVHIRSGLSG